MPSDFDHLVRVERELLIGERLLAAVDQLAQDLPRVRALHRVLLQYQINFMINL